MELLTTEPTPRLRRCLEYYMELAATFAIILTMTKRVHSQTASTCYNAPKACTASNNIPITALVRNSRHPGPSKATQACGVPQPP